jgi:hypothetical protein
MARRQWALLATSLFLYYLLHAFRMAITTPWLRDSTPSLLFFPAAFSLVGLAPKRWGGAGGAAVRKQTWVAGTIIGIVLIEGVGPALGQGTFDLRDVIALLLGSLIYALIVSD